MPSTSKAAQTAAIRRSSASGSPTARTRSWAAAMRAATSDSSRCPARGERLRIVLEREPAAHHLHPGVHVPRRPHLDREAEPVEKLRSQLALLRVHRAHQQEPRRVRHRHAVALDVRATHRGRVEQQVDEVVVQEVDLVDVEHAPVGVGEQPGLVGPHPFGQRALQVQRPDEPVLGRPDRQLHEPSRACPDRSTGAVRPVRAGGVGIGRVATEPASRHHHQLGQERRERADRRRLRGALLPAHQHPAHPGVHRVEQQREPQVVMADDRGEREPGSRDGGGHRGEPARPDVITGSSAGAP